MLCGANSIVCNVKKLLYKFDIYFHNCSQSPRRYEDERRYPPPQPAGDYGTRPPPPVQPVYGERRADDRYVVKVSWCINVIIWGYFLSTPFMIRLIQVRHNSRFLFSDSMLLTVYIVF